MRRTIRRKTSHGYIVSITYDQIKSDQKWKVVGMGKVRNGRNPVPVDFLPFDLSNAVVNGPRFDTEQECIAFVRGL